MTPTDDIRKIIAGLKATNLTMKNIVEHPEIIEAWTPVQRAWMMEHIELLKEEMKALQVTVEKEIERRRKEQ